MDSNASRTRVPARLPAIAAVALATLAAAVVAPAAAGAAELGYARVESACPAPQPGQASCFAMVRRQVSAAQAAQPDVHPFTTGDGAAAAGPAGGLTPADLASAYGIDPSGGAGETVAIVDAFDDPSIESDLGKFDKQYELPACTEADGCFEKVGQTGSPAALPSPDTSGWSVEISLDVEAVHAVCRSCKILLVEANNSEFRNLGAAVDEAVAMGAAVVSNSYGGYEANGSSEERANYNHPGVVITVATGDQGWDSWIRYYEGYAPPSPPRPNVPSSLPTVVGVGGTTLHLNAEGKRTGETVWNGNGSPVSRPEFLEGATGGGCSVLFTAPLWQQDTAGFGATGCGSKRSAADVAAVADPLTGFDIYDTYNCGAECERFKGGQKWLTIGGTSLAAPVIGAMYGLAGGSRGVRYPALTPYGHSGESADTYDVSSGGNGYCDESGQSCGIDELLSEHGLPYSFDCEGTTACNATAGFDGPTGVGAPASLGFFEPLSPSPQITLPSKRVTGAPLSFGASASTDPYPGGTAEATYEWSFGDGQSATGVAPSHTYAAAGKYTVSVTMTDSYGLKAAKSAEITVTPRTAEEIAEEEAAAKKQAEEEAAAKKQAEEEAATRKKAEEEARQKAAEEAARRAGEEAALEAREAEERARLGHESPVGQAGAPNGSQGSAGVASFKTAPPDAVLSGTSLHVSAGGSFTLDVSCPTGETSCEGTVEVRAANGAAASGAGAPPLAHAAFKVAGGKVVKLRLRLSRRGRAMLARHHSLRVRVLIAASDPEGAHGGSQSPAVLHAARRG